MLQEKNRKWGGKPGKADRLKKKERVRGKEWDEIEKIEYGDGVGGETRAEAERFCVCVCKSQFNFAKIGFCGFLSYSDLAASLPQKTCCSPRQRSCQIIFTSRKLNALSSSTGFELLKKPISCKS